MKAFYCAGTHWDREWYESFQGYRMWLVDLIDEAMDVMEREPDYRCFHLDGQAVVLQDYLEIRPENRERLVKFINDGRLIVGPWYNLPDEWLISGESFVRNMMAGMKYCRDLGVEPMNFGYTPDQFGHIAALPMIMTGFGLQAGIVWRGTRDETHEAVFNWIGPDGSRLPYYKLRDHGAYAPWKFRVRDPHEAAGGSQETFDELVEKYFEDEAARTPAPICLLLDAIDHDRVHPEMVDVFKDLRKKYPDIEFHWASLAEFAEEMVKHAENAPEFQGEMREPTPDPFRRGHYLIVHTISSRYPVKRANDQCQALLEKWTEPYALFESMAGGPMIPGYLEKAWEYLLRNHPHDSICGCSIDQVHRDMMYRFDQCRLIGEKVVKRSYVTLAGADASDEALKHVVVHNPLPFSRKCVVELPLHMKHGWPNHYVDGLQTGERINRFHLVKKDGTRVPYQLSRIERNEQSKIPNSDRRDRTIRGQDVYHVALELELPACGYTGLTIEPTPDATRHPKTLRTASLTADNGVLRVTVNNDGTASVTHKTSGVKFDELFQYEDRGDVGDGWTYGQLIDDIEFCSAGTRCTTAVEEDGPFRTVFRIERWFDLPDHADVPAYKRSGERTSMAVIDRLSVEKGAPYVRVRTTIKNNVKDHRFRVLFPTHADTTLSFADSPYAIVERAIPTPPEAASWHERWNPEKPLTTFCGVQDGHRGLALLCPFGPHEYAVSETPERVLALTLFRSTFKTVWTSGEPDGELQEDLEYEYLLYPFTGAFDPVAASRYVSEAQVKVGSHYALDTPGDESYLELKNGMCVVTAIKPALDGEGGVVRLWNPSNEEVEDYLTFKFALKSAALCNLNEDILDPITVEDPHELPVIVPARGLSTIRFTW